jgi:hypothetical protein
VVRALHPDLTGRPVPRGTPVEGRRFVVEHMDALAAVGLHRHGRLTLSGWLSSLREVEEPAWMSGDDPMPAVALGARFVLHGLTRIPAAARLLPARGEHGGTGSTPRFLPGRAVVAIGPRAARPGSSRRDRSTGSARMRSRRWCI